MNGKNVIFQCISVVVCGVFLFTSLTPTYARTLALPQPGTMLHTTPAYTPVMLQGVKVNPDNPFLLDFIVDQGDVTQGVAEESELLIKYFLAAMTITEEDLWVNLSPHEQDRIIPDEFGHTEMGRDLLAQDYLLKQLTSSLMYPEDELGEKFWNEVYSKAFEEYGTTDIPVDTFNKVWIVPEKAVVYEGDGAAYVVESRLKVMLESDYTALEHHSAISGRTIASEVNELGKNAVREVILPAIEREVNEGQHFAKLRQIYQSLILATWFKQKMKASLLTQVYADQSKVEGVNHQDPEAAQKIWQQYTTTFKEGVYNFIKEEHDPWTDDIIPRHYFSGGAGLMDVPLEKETDLAMMSDKWRDRFNKFLVVLNVVIYAGASPLFHMKSKVDAEVARAESESRAVDHQIYMAKINQRIQDTLRANNISQEIPAGAKEKYQYSESDMNILQQYLTQGVIDRLAQSKNNVERVKRLGGVDILKELHDALGEEGYRIILRNSNSMDNFLSIAENIGIEKLIES